MPPWILSGTGMDPAASPIHGISDGSAFAAGPLWLFGGPQSSKALDMPAFNTGDLLVCYCNNLRADSMTPTAGGWTAGSNSGQDEVWLRYATGGAQDQFTMPALGTADTFGYAIVISIPTAYSALGPKWNGGVYPGSPNPDIRYPNQAENDPGNSSIIVYIGRRYGVYGPYTFAGPVDPNVHLVVNARGTYLGIVQNYWCSFQIESLNSAQPSGSYLPTPWESKAMYSWAFRIRLT